MNADQTQGESLPTEESPYASEENPSRRNAVILSVYGAFFGLIILAFFLISKNSVSFALPDIRSFGSALGSISSGMLKRIASIQSTKRADVPVYVPISSPMPTAVPTDVQAESQANTITPTPQRKKSAPANNSNNTPSTYTYVNTYVYPTPKPGEPGSAEWEADFQRTWNKMETENAQAQKHVEEQVRLGQERYVQMQKDREAFMKEWNTLNDQLQK